MSVTTLERLHHSDDRNGKPHVIFIHGLGGHPRETWMADSSDAATLWPKWVGEDADCNVWTLGYDAALSGWTDVAMPLPQQATSVLDALNNEADLRGHALILVGHSLGGLVIKQVVSNAMTLGVNRFRDLIDRMRGVVFVGTPHNGSELATPALAYKELLRTNEQVDALRVHNANVLTLHAQFRGFQQQLGFKVRSFAETRGVLLGRNVGGIALGPRVMVVNSGSADPHVVGEVPIPLAEDHVSICKPKYREHQIHKSLLEFIEMCRRPTQLPPGTDKEHAVLPEIAATELSIAGSRKRPPALLIGAHDNRLQSRESDVIGREDEIQDVLDFLRKDVEGPATYAQVTGVGGTGKTEVCKAALKRWLAKRPDEIAFFIDVPDSANAGELWYRLGRGLAVDNITSLDELRPHLLPGLYYLDNLESLVEKADGQDALRALRDHPDVRLLVSSRVSLPTVFGRPISIGSLPHDTAVTLFRDLWNGGDPLPAPVPAGQVERFVEEDLGCHALCVSLVARLGDTHSFPGLVTRWKEIGATLASDAIDNSRLGSLTVSLQLTSDILASRPGALDLWTVAALFPTGVEEWILDDLERSGKGSNSSRQILVRHHILSLRGDRFVLLSPVGRYALDKSFAEEGGFSWTRVRPHINRLFLEMAWPAAVTASTAEALAAREKLLRQFGAILRFVLQEEKYRQPKCTWLQELDGLLRNQYQFSVALASELLPVLISQLEYSAGATLSLGELECRLGRLDQARRLYDHALSLFERAQDESGQAHTLKSLGDLERRLSRFDEARRLYGLALALFERAQDELGQANTLKSLGDLAYRLRQFSEARRLYNRAFALFKREQAGLGQAYTLKSLGDLACRLDQFDEARRLYGRAFTLFERSHSALGQANTLQSLGDLIRGSGDHGLALKKYEGALRLYAAVKDPLGTAYTYAEVARCQHALGRIDDRDAALIAAYHASHASGTEDVKEYVKNVLIELTGGGENLRSWVEHHLHERNDPDD